MAIATYKGLEAALIEHVTYNKKLWSEHLSDCTAYKKIPPHQIHAVNVHMKYVKTWRILLQMPKDPPSTHIDIF